MSQALDLKINRLPAGTWNWLHVNETSLNLTEMPAEGRVEVDNPGFLTGTAGADPLLDGIETGMGKDMDSLAKTAGIATQNFKSLAGREEIRPLRLHFHSEDDGRALHVIGLTAEENSGMTVVMDDASKMRGHGLAGIQTKILAKKNSRVRLVQIHRHGESRTCLNDVGVVCQEGAQVEIIQFFLGGGQTYVGCLAQLEGKGSSLRLDAGYLAGGKDRLDINYVARHAKEETESCIHVAGALRGRAFKLFRGTIDFLRGSFRSEGEVKEDVLLLDDAVVNQTVPLILCGEEDVQGNHGATIGRLDEALLFYLEARGLSREIIYEMLAKARIKALCGRIQDEKTRLLVERYLEGGGETDEL